MKNIFLSTLLIAGLLGMTACNSSDGGIVDTSEESFLGSVEDAAEIAKNLPDVAVLEEKLGLGDEQKSQMETALVEFRAAIRERHAHRSEAVALEGGYPRLEFLEKAHGILNRDQFRNLVGLMAEHRAQLRSGHAYGPHHGAGPHAASNVHRGQGAGDPAARQALMQTHHDRLMDFLNTVLDLSDEQRASLEELFAKQQAFREEAHAGGERPNREQMQAHHEAMQTAVAEILNVEQVELLQSLHMPGRGHGFGGG
ncbi:MAG TPA: hypothetical protein VGB13_03540 [Candidatus Krumholzibacteria bacterium]|jgi:hypothetical protein